MSIPKMRSDGARSTGAAMTAATIAAMADTDRRSAARRNTMSQSNHNRQRDGDSPPANVAHVREHAAVHADGTNGQQPADLCQFERGEPGGEPRPADADKCRNPQREIETDLECREKRNRALRIVDRHAGERGDDAR